MYRYSLSIQFRKLDTQGISGFVGRWDNCKYVTEWKKVEPEYELARQILRARLKRKMTQAELAKKAGTGQAVISRLEGAKGSPSLSLLKRVARVLETNLMVKVG